MEKGEVESARGLDGVSLHDLKRHLRKLSDKDLEELFDDARSRLRRECAKPGTASTFRPAFSDATISRLKSGDEEYSSEKFDRIYKERLLWYYRLPGASSFYNQLADLIGQDESDKESILSRYQGEYRYFRYAAKVGEPPKYVQGKIRIWNQDGDPVFGHWSHDYPFKSLDPEHAGFVFRAETHLFLAARAPGVLRLSIARTHRGDPGKASMLGLTLSMRNPPTQDPFAARFLLVHCDNKALIARLDPDLPGAESRFREMIKPSDHDHYMLIEMANGA